MQQTTQRRLLTGVAVAGVLGAGALATAVNASILDSGSDTAAAEQTASATDLIIPAVDPTTSAPAPTVPPVEVIRITADELAQVAATTTTPTTTAASSTTAPAPAITTTEFSIGATGVVTVTSDGTSIMDVGAAPGVGWTVVDTDEDKSAARVVFRSSDTEVVFDVVLENGQFVTDVSARALPRPVTTVVGHDDHDDDHDDDDDEYENDDRDDEYDDEYDDDHDDDDEYDDD